MFRVQGECSCPAARVPKPNCVGVPNGPTCVDKAFCYKAANRVMQLGTLVRARRRVAEVVMIAHARRMRRVLIYLGRAVVLASRMACQSSPTST